MAEIVRLTKSSNWIDLGFVERERTLKPLMEVGIRLHLKGLSLSDTVSELEKFGGQRSRKAVHNWVHKAEIDTYETASPDQVALDETVVKIGGEIFRLYSTIDPETNETLLTRLYSTRKTVLTQRLLQELHSEHDIDDATFLVDGAPWLQTALDRCGLAYRHETIGDRTAAERVYKEVKLRTYPFKNTF